MSPADPRSGDAPSLRTLGRRRAFPLERLRAPAPEAAPDLLGALLVRDEGDGAETVVRVVETEAYRESDPASHSYRGRTPRTAVMFGPPGRAYVYFTYGMHFCVNVTCEDDGVGAAVLMRAGIVLVGEERVRERRGPRHRPRDLLAGPARLTQGLAIDRSLDGAHLLDPTSPLRLECDGWRPAPSMVRGGPRVGVRLGADVPWRFWIDGVAEVSRYSRHPGAPAPERERGPGDVV